MQPQESLPTSVVPDAPHEDGSHGQSLPFPCRRPVRLTLSLLLGVFAVSMLAWGFLPGLLDPTFERHIQDKDVIVGMTREKPCKPGLTLPMNITYPTWFPGEWVYEDWIDAGSVKHRYLYFEEGVLVGGWK